MRVAIIADLHIGNHRLFGGKTEAGVNARCAKTLASMERAYSLADETGCDTMVIAGDLYDTDAPSPQIIAKVAQIIQQRAGVMETVIIKGNHDSNSPAPGDHALGPLAPVARIVEAPETLGPLLLLPFAPNATEWVSEAVAHGPATIVVSHFGIANASTAEYLLASSVQIDMLRNLASQHKLSLWFSGDWHTHAVFPSPGFTAVQIGALTPTGFNNPGMNGYGSVIIVDTDTMRWARIEVPGPRFVYTKRADLSDIPPRGTFNTHTYVKLAEPSPEREEALAALKASGQIDDYVVATEVRSETDATGEGVVDAVASVEASDIESALIPYVRAMSIPEADKPKVIETCQLYLMKHRS